MDKDLLKVSVNDDTGLYTVSVGEGSNLAETAFCVAVIAKCFVRDGVIPTADVFTELVDKYINDPQFDEATPEGDNKVCQCGKMLHYDEELGAWKCDDCGYTEAFGDA